MRNLLRLSWFVLAPTLPLAAMGCSQDTTLTDNDSGVILPDTGIGPGDGSTQRDSGITPFPDTGLPPIDGGGPPPIDGGGPPPRPDGGFPPRPDGGGGTTDAGIHGGGPDGGVACGSAVCTGTDVCCVTRGTGGPTESCTAPSACMGAAVYCTSAADCTGGQVCCGSFGGGSAMAMCADAASCMYRLCTSMADCTAGQTCRMFGGIGVCF